MHFTVKKWATRTPSEENRFKSERVPKMMARRCSPLSLLALDVVLELSEEGEADFGIFASRHGEISRTTALLNDIAERQELSPTAFSQSVHNTAAGLFTIIKKSHIKISSLAAGPKTLQMAFVEAAAFLKKYPQKKVILVYFDQKLPEVYQKSLDEISIDFALGLQLEAAPEGQNSHFEYVPQLDATNQGVEFLSGFLKSKEMSVKVSVS